MLSRLSILRALLSLTLAILITACSGASIPPNSIVFTNASSNLLRCQEAADETENYTDVAPSESKIMDGLDKNSYLRCRYRLSPCSSTAFTYFYPESLGSYTFSLQDVPCYECGGEGLRKATVVTLPNGASCNTFYDKGQQTSFDDSSIIRYEMGDEFDVWFVAIYAPLTFKGADLHSITLRTRSHAKAPWLLQTPMKLNKKSDGEADAWVALDKSFGGEVSIDASYSYADCYPDKSNYQHEKVFVLPDSHK